MPGGFPLGIEVCNGQDVGVVTSSSTGTTVTASSTANTKGSYAQLIATTAADCVMVYIQATNLLAVTVNFLVDIAIGPSGSEKVVVPNIFMVGASATGGSCFDTLIPLSIPQGTAVSARCQCSTASGAISLKLTTFDGAFTHSEGAAGYDDLGTSTSTSGGATITASSTTNTKGAYTQLIASTARDYRGLLLDFGKTPAAGDGFNLYDIAIGAAGSEVIIASNLMVGNMVNAAVVDRQVFLPISIPAGTAISVRMQSTVASNTCTMTAYGAYL